MSAIVVYYSLEGNTDYAAKEIAQKLGADLLRIFPIKTYPTSGFRKFLWGGKSAIMAEKPELQPYEFDASLYDCVIFGTPVWASNIAPPLRSFVLQNKDALANKHISAFACQSGNGAEKALAKLCDCLDRSTLDAELVLIDPLEKPDAHNDTAIDTFCKKVAQ